MKSLFVNYLWASEKRYWFMEKKTVDTAYKLLSVLFFSLVVFLGVSFIVNLGYTLLAK